MKRLIVTLLLVLAGALAVAEPLTLDGKIIVDTDEWEVTPSRMMTTWEYFDYLCDLCELSKEQKTYAQTTLALRLVLLEEGKLITDTILDAAMPTLKAMPSAGYRISNWIVAQCGVHHLMYGWVDDVSAAIRHEKQ